MASRSFHPGEWVIYRLQKVSTKPGPRAQDVIPAAHGEDYSYLVDKFWIVEEVLADGKLKLRTRRGKIRQVSPDDHRLRRPRFWERWLFAARFRAVEAGNQSDVDSLDS